MGVSGGSAVGLAGDRPEGDRFVSVACEQRCGGVHAGGGGDGRGGGADGVFAECVAGGGLVASRDDLRRLADSLLHQRRAGVELAAAGSIQATGSPLWIGGNEPYDEDFSGRIDEVRVYRTVLAATEIQEDMALPVTPDPNAPKLVIATPAEGATTTGGNRAINYRPPAS